jgi:hypothetical protein
MAYRSEIIRALEELIANEGGDLFQSAATLHATQKWTQLVACERKFGHEFFFRSGSRGKRLLTFL